MDDLKKKGNCGPHTIFTKHVIVGQSAWIKSELLLLH